MFFVSFKISATILKFISSSLIIMSYGNILYWKKNNFKSLLKNFNDVIANKSFILTDTVEFE